MKHIFIVNPVAGKGKANELIKYIEELCVEYNVDYAICKTTEKGEAEGLARVYANSDVCVIHSVGGDGTLNEIVNGMVGSNSYLSVIPAGSGNDFSKTLTNNQDPKEIIKNNIDGQTVTSDIGLINNDRYFINIATIGGIDALSGYYAEKMKKIKLPPQLIYNAGLVCSFLLYRSPRLYIELDNEIIDQYITIFTVCNGKYYGGGYNIAPQALYNDGLFDVYIAGRINRLRIPSLTSDVKNGTHGKYDFVKMHRSERIKITGDRPLICNFDGETLISDKFDITMKKEAVKIKKM